MRKPINISEDCCVHLANSSIAICGLARNCAHKLSANIKFIEALKIYFKFLQVVVVENGSHDNTRVILENWSVRSSNVIILDGINRSTISISDQIDRKVNPYYSYKRISYLATLRNQYLNYIGSDGRAYDYILILDFDVDEISLTGVLNSFEQRDSWDVACAYGYSISPRLQERIHDTYAMVLIGEEDNPQQEGPIKQLQRDVLLNKNSGSLFPVYSAFGGLSIYKAGLLYGINYQALKNDDSKVEVRCEHFSICHQLHKNQATRVAINPRMHLRYELLFETLSRFFDNLIQQPKH
jgi:glycosyltransferase involved in cell wall biosynthesis